jgi:hypothetical protein
MFEPGHLHLQHAKLLPDEVGYDIHLKYEVRTDAEHGALMHFDISGQIDGKGFEDQFDLPEDMACNFASNAERIAHKHGLPKAKVLPIAVHKQYDAMFEDVRSKLGRHSGDPVNTERV